LLTRQTALLLAPPGAHASRGVVEDGDLGTLLRGVNPATDKQLRKSIRERTITVRTLDVETGYDLVFSCPKSVSLLHALTDKELVRREISEAHEASWQAALAYLEQDACVVRRGKGGKVREHGQGFVAAAFRHRASRAQDPHVHTHVVVANMARAEDGEWLALDGEAILKTYRLARRESGHLRGMGFRRSAPSQGSALRELSHGRNLQQRTVAPVRSRRHRRRRAAAPFASVPPDNLA
jgi:conjugative relaxase-like TrwC/TraI family protein